MLGRVSTTGTAATNVRTEGEKLGLEPQLGPTEQAGRKRIIDAAGVGSTRGRRRDIEEFDPRGPVLGAVKVIVPLAVIPVKRRVVAPDVGSGDP